MATKQTLIPDFKPRFTFETWRHDKWTYLFCRGGPTMEACPSFEERKPAEWHMDRDFCTATGACIHRMDVDLFCPRRDELSAKLHAEVVARTQAKAKAKREYLAAHPPTEEPEPARAPKSREQQIAEALKP